MYSIMIMISYKCTSLKYATWLQGSFWGFHVFVSCIREMASLVFRQEKGTPVTMMEDKLLLQEIKRAHFDVCDLWQHLTQLLLI